MLAVGSPARVLAQPVETHSLPAAVYRSMREWLWHPTMGHMWTVLSTALHKCCQHSCVAQAHCFSTILERRPRMLVCRAFCLWLCNIRWVAVWTVRSYRPYVRQPCCSLQRSNMLRLCASPVGRCHGRACMTANMAHCLCVVRARGNVHRLHTYLLSLGAVEVVCLCVSLAF